MRFEVAGHAIDYEIRGDGRTIVLLHGLTIDRRVLIEACEPILSARPGWRRVYLDLPGHGASRGDPGRASADDLVEALATFVREVCPTGVRPSLLGYSYGGYLALGLAREVEVDGLFLLCPVIEPDFGRRTVPPRRVVATEEDLPFSDDPREREAFAEIATHQTRAVLEAFQRVVHPANISVDPEVVGAVRFRYAMARLWGQAIAQLDRPVSILCARDDHWVGYADAFRLAERMRRATYTAVADCGQLLPLEAPGRFHGELAAWLERVEAEA